VNNITRAEQHGASGLIATHARFFDAGSHGGGPEIPHEDECEKFGPSSAYFFRPMARFGAKTCHASPYPRLGLTATRNGAVSGKDAIDPMRACVFTAKIRVLGTQFMPPPGAVL